MKKDISRRDFIKGAAVSTLSISAMGMLSACTAPPEVPAGPAAPPEVPAAPSAPPASVSPKEIIKQVSLNEPEKWDYEADIIIVGTGTSCYGSIKMADSGLSIIAMDSYATAGGATGISGGMQWLPNNKFSQGFGDTREKSLKYVKAMRKTAPISDLQCEAFVDNAGPMLDYITPILESTSVGIVATQTEGFGDFYPHWDGGLDQGRTVDFRVPGNIFGATDWRKAYLEAQETRGVQFVLGMKATKLVSRFDKDGVPEVLGVIAVKNGREIAFKANKGVLLNTGGFDWNEKLCNTFLATPTKYACSLNTCVGSGLEMSMALGADLCNMTETFGHITYKEKAEEQKALGVPVNIMYERMMPRQIIVNSSGRRFINESTDYDSSWRAMAGYKTYGDHDLENVPCWIVMDSKHVADYGFNVSAFIGPVDERGVPPFFKEGATLRELAEKCNIDPDGLEDEVAKFNKYCENMYDPDFHRGENPFEWHFFSDTSKPEGPARNLGPINVGPYYAGELAPAMLGTNGGPRLNEFAQVMHVSGSAIGRLYACGNCAGFGGPGPGYGGGGGTIGPGLVMGYIAANHILDNLKTNWDGTNTVGVVTKIDPADLQVDDAGVDLSYVAPVAYNPGTYTAIAQGMDKITVTMTFSADAITDIQIDGPGETAGIGADAIEKIIAKVKETKSGAIDTVSGATITSKAVKEAVADCIAQATR